MDRRLCEEIELALGSTVVALNIPQGQWHTVRGLKSGAVVMEMKDEPYKLMGPDDIME